VEFLEGRHGPLRHGGQTWFGEKGTDPVAGGKTKKTGQKKGGRGGERWTKFCLVLRGRAFPIEILTEAAEVYFSRRGGGGGRSVREWALDSV